MPRPAPLALVALVLLATPAGDLATGGGALAVDAPLPVYSSDLADLRNRIFHALFTSPVPAVDASHAAPVTRIEGGPRAAIAWGAARGAILDDPRHADVVTLLERALDDRSLRAMSPLHRVLLQHDLWTAHDALALRRPALADALRAARCDEMQALLARLVVRLAPRADEIDALPPTPLPSDVGAVIPGDAPTHAAARGGRVAFERRAGALPDEIALVGRLIAIDARGALCPTPIVASVEIAGRDRAFVAAHALDRAALLESPLDPRVLGPLGAADPVPTAVAAAGAIAYASRAERCASCHAAPPPLVPPPALAPAIRAAFAAGADSGR